jgi:hypothetical protein
MMLKGSYLQYLNQLKSCVVPIQRRKDGTSQSAFNFENPEAEMKGTESLNSLIGTGNGFTSQSPI